jgi:hypothetical protein
MRMRKPRWVLAGLAVLLLAAGAFVARPRSDRITKENFDRIRVGMNRAETEAVFGGPPGDYTNGSTWTASSGFALAEVGDDGESRIIPLSEWQSDTLIAWIVFDESGKVMHKESAGNSRMGRGPLESLLWRAKRQWRKWFPEKP